MHRVKKVFIALLKSVYQALVIMLMVALAIVFAFWPMFLLGKYDTAVLFIANWLWIIFVFLVLYRMGENLK